MNEKQINKLLALLDEAVGSWHRFVDAIEKIADKHNE